MSSRYATIELELLAVVWALSKCKFYLIGLQHFDLIADYRPLVPILNHYSLDAIKNPRLQRLKEKILAFVFTAAWRAGKKLCISDALSRSPVSSPTPEDEMLSTEAGFSVSNIVTLQAVQSLASTQASVSPPDSDLALEELRTVTRDDLSYIQLLESVRTGFPRDRFDLHNALRPYWKIREDLYADGDLVLYGARVVVPAALHRRVLARLHNTHRPSSPADFFSTAGKHFLVVADRLSGWPVVVICGSDTTSAATIRHFWHLFRDLAVPSNGHAEAAVKAVKHLILKVAPSGNIDCEAFDKGLLELRNTPTHSGRSPAQILYGHPLRSCVPAHAKAFAKEWQTRAESCDRRAATRAQDTKARNDDRARPLQPLEIGALVRVQDPTTTRWDKVGIVMGVGRSRDYKVRMPSGCVWWRNRRFLQPVPPPAASPLTEDESPTPHEDPSHSAPRRSERLRTKKSAQDKDYEREGGREM
ncbi:pol Retrovirus-related Pol polyprotein from transposon-like 4 [Homarus americanus]|uniref:Pol Retrovirus-related Pol polyprotein from transposon-like 4 n=1 Tax=Homarus americanus TaxID=6706 RepID=A0A8J5JA70_HOMAM|nr:pol Retrovirus-related Pol polyprotein from transposon-like 4 [Homarus americanus]